VPQSEDRQKAKDAFHVAKLALFNVRLLHDFESVSGQSEEIDRIIKSRSSYDNVAFPVSLMHQGTFLPFAYICMVWLWEIAKAEDNSDVIICEAQKKFDFSSVIKSANGPRTIKMPAHVIRLVRNAISHARVTTEDSCFSFSDIGGKEKTPTTIRLTWSELGQLSEAILFAINAWLYPAAEVTSA